MKIWRLSTKDRISGYPFVQTKEEAQYYLKVFKKFYRQKLVIEHWQPTLICNLHEVDIGQVVFNSQQFWIITEKANEVLAPLIKDKAEYLPLLSRKEFYKKISTYKQLRYRKTYKPIIETIHLEQQYLLNILDIKTAEIIDFKHSEFEYDEEDDTIYAINKLGFLPEKIKNTHMFKIKNAGIYFRSAIFVSDEFRKIVEANNLTGLKFIDKPEDEGGNLVWSQSS